MKKETRIIIGIIIGALIIACTIYFKPMPAPETRNVISDIKDKEKDEYCYFQSTYGDIVKIKIIDCKEYLKPYFNTIHWDSLPHGYIK